MGGQRRHFGIEKPRNRTLRALFGIEAEMKAGRHAVPP
jgi:hypothetical protein